jgi:allophanate hydrolase subunit 2
MGGVEGRALRAGDRLPVGVPSEPPIPGRTLPPVVPLPAGGADLRIIPGPEAETCAEMLQSIASHTFTISSTSDRMAYRLETCRPESDVRRPRPTSLSEVRGPESEVRGQVSVEIISDATPLGTVQLPPSGQPMILMADRQTCGGYPRIATVIAADLARAGQLAPGDWVRFHRCTLAEAMAALIEQERVFVR